MSVETDTARLRFRSVRLPFALCYGPMQSGPVQVGVRRRGCKLFDELVVFADVQATPRSHPDGTFGNLSQSVSIPLDTSSCYGFVFLTLEASYVLFLVFMRPGCVSPGDGTVRTFHPSARVAATTRITCGPQPPRPASWHSYRRETSNVSRNSADRSRDQTAR